MNAEPAFVSTGSLPPGERVRLLVAEAYNRFRGVDEGELSQVYPSLANADPSRFGICVTSTTGEMATAGDATAPFALMSVAKPFVLALVSDVRGADDVLDFVGANATGRRFNSLSAIEDRPDGRTNPMVNPGAMATTSMSPGRTTEEKWEFLRGGLSRFAGRELVLNADVFASASATNAINRAIGGLLHSRGRLASEPDEVVDLYTRQSSLEVTATDLAVMAATLADGGVNPVTGVRVADPTSCRNALVMMATAGLYESSGEWLWRVGLPGKSGIAGGIVMVSPGKGGLGTFGPRLDVAGNSVCGQLAAGFLSRALGLDVFASVPADRLQAQKGA